MATQVSNDLEKPLILLVDDEEQIISSLRRVLVRQNFDVQGFVDPHEALAFLQTARPHVVISDMRMPIMSGQDFLARVFAIRPECYRIVLTGYADIEATLDVVNRGGISGFLQKPWNSEQLVSVVSKGVAHTQLYFDNERLQRELADANANLEEKVERRTKQIKAALTKLQQVHQSNLNVIFNLLSAHPNINGEFAKKVSLISSRIAEQLDADAELITQTTLAGLLCELGYIGLPFQLCQIPFTKMSAGQISEFKKQSEIASQILSPSSYWNDVAKILREQYTAFQPLSPNVEPPRLGAQIIAIVRDYFRMLDGRYFSKPVSMQKALAELLKHSGSRYSDEILDTIRRHPHLLESKHNPGNYLIEDIQPGMRLIEDIYTNDKILLLPKGHVFNLVTVNRLRYFRSSLPEGIKIAIADSDDEYINRDDVQ